MTFTGLDHVIVNTTNSDFAGAELDDTSLFKEAYDTSDATMIPSICGTGQLRFTTTDVQIDLHAQGGICAASYVGHVVLPVSRDTINSALSTDYDDNNDDYGSNDSWTKIGEDIKSYLTGTSSSHDSEYYFGDTNTDDIVHVPGSIRTILIEQYQNVYNNFNGFGEQLFADEHLAKKPIDREMLKYMMNVITTNTNFGLSSDPTKSPTTTYNEYDVNDGSDTNDQNGLKVSNLAEVMRALKDHGYNDRDTNYSLADGFKVGDVLYFPNGFQITSSITIENENDETPNDLTSLTVNTGTITKDLFLVVQDGLPAESGVRFDGDVLYLENNGGIIYAYFNSDNVQQGINYQLINKKNNVLNLSFLKVDEVKDGISYEWRILASLHYAGGQNVTTRRFSDTGLINLTTGDDAAIYPYNSLTPIT